ncbi:ArsR/SmtB family transcription factor [Lichenicola sp.]|uniref:ArsR/SmtB family transcription factor n=1 Tax=Lichenicola sp. TaxID=2804529 RepID=UPI003AFF6E70
MGDGAHAQAGDHDAPSGPALRLDKVFQALSDPVRLGIVIQLHREGESSCAALDGGRPKSTMSHHFRVLREAGLVETRAQGVTHINTLCRDRLDAAFPGLLDAIVSAAGASRYRADAYERTPRG